MRLIWFKMKNQLTREGMCHVGFYVVQYVCPYLSHTRCVLEESMYVFQIHRIWDIHTNFSRSIFWIQKIFCSMTHWLFYAGIQYATLFQILIESSLMGKIQDQSVTTYVFDSLSVLTLATGI